MFFVLVIDYLTKYFDQRYNKCIAGRGDYFEGD